MQRIEATLVTGNVAKENLTLIKWKYLKNQRIRPLFVGPIHGQQKVP